MDLVILDLVASINVELNTSSIKVLTIDFDIKPNHFGPMFSHDAPFGTLNNLQPLAQITLTSS